MHGDERKHMITSRVENEPSMFQETASHKHSLQRVQKQNFLSTLNTKQVQVVTK